MQIIKNKKKEINQSADSNLNSNIIPVKSNDDSQTFVNENLNEAYHSTTGALDEAFRKFVQPCKIAELAKSGKIKILDVCFGIGYKSAVAIDVALKENPDCEIEIIGLENDINILDKIQEVNPKLKFYYILKELKKECSVFAVSKPNVKINIFLGDARITINDLEDEFDAVFFDPFSPKNQPELWTKDFFYDIKKKMKTGAILTTYSCARLVRDNLRATGFLVSDGPKVKRRGPSTIAKKK